MADDVIAARSERARLRVGGLALEVGSPFTIPLPAEDRYVLEFAADAHGVSTAGLALAIVQTVLAEGLLDSLLDDREAVASDDVRPRRRRRRRGARTASASIAATSFSMDARRRRIERLVEVDRLPKLLANEVILCASSRSPYASRSILGNW